MESPLSRAWTALTRYSPLALIPIGWDFLTLAVGWLFKSGPLAERSAIQIKLLVPSSLPSGLELVGGAQVQNLLAPAQAPLLLLLGLIMAVLGALVTAGFLFLLRGALEENPPSWDRFVEGINRYGARLFLWKLVVTLIILAGAILAMGVGALAPVFLLAGLIAALAYYLVPFLIVAEDLTVAEAIGQSPGRLVTAFGPLLQVALVSALLSAALSFALTAMGAGSILLASPLWAFFGSWGTLGVMAVLRPAPPIWAA